MLIAYQGEAFESPNLSKDDLNHFLLVVMPRISPLIIMQQVLGHFRDLWL